MGTAYYRLSGTHPCFVSGEETSTRPSYPSSSNIGETLEITSEQNSWSTGPSSRSTNNVRSGPPEKRASTSSAPSGRAFSTTSASLSSLAVCRSPGFETLKKQRVLRTPCSIPQVDYIPESVGYKAAAYVLPIGSMFVANAVGYLTHMHSREQDSWREEKVI